MRESASLIGPPEAVPAVSHREFPVRFHRGLDPVAWHSAVSSRFAIIASLVLCSLSNSERCPCQIPSMPGDFAIRS